VDVRILKLCPIGSNISYWENNITNQKITSIIMIKVQDHILDQNLREIKEWQRQEDLK